MKTKIEVLKNFFTKNEEDVLRNLVEQNRKLERGSSRFAPMIIKSMSREQIEFLVPEEIKEKLLNTAKQFVDDPDLELTHYQYLDYFGKYGEGASPNLPPHLDVENYYTKVSIDYQMSSNIDWAIVVEDNNFILNNNDVLVFEAAERIHWREPVLLKENDRCEVIVFHFSNKFDHQPYIDNPMGQEERDLIIEKHKNIPRMKDYREKFFNQLKQLEGK